MKLQTELKIFGMNCAGCASGIERKMLAKEGILEAHVDFASKRGSFRYDDVHFDSQSLMDSVQDLGYEAFPVDSDIEEEEGHYSKQLIPGLILFIPLFILGMFFKEIPYSSQIQAFLASIAFIYLGRPYFLSAFHGLLNGIMGMDLLVTLGSGSAFLISWLGFFGQGTGIYFDGSIAILVFLTIGKSMEEQAKKSAFSSLEDLLVLSEKKVRVLREGQVEEIKIRKLDLGDVILVPAGEMIPVDGRVIEGNSSVDESLLTGEAEPVFKEQNSQVSSGSKNLEQVLKIKVTKIGRESTLAQIGEQIKKARLQKANLQRTADKIAYWFVPTVLSIAIGTFFYWYTSGQANSAWINSICVLLIACPCALGLATPAALSVGLSTGLKAGILIRNIKVIENMSQVTHLLLDKTGTLTMGKPVLERLELYSGEEEFALRLAAGLEQNAHHPFARAILGEVKNRNLLPLQVKAVEGNVGQGLSGKFEGEEYLLGSPSFLRENAIPVNDENFMGFFLASKKELIGRFEFNDPERPGKEALQSFFKQSRVIPCLLSGDREDRVKEMASRYGIQKAIFEVKPWDKMKQVEEFQDEGGFVAMIGDGLNDSSALARANLGISFQEGSELARSSADMVLLREDLKLIPRAFHLSYSIRKKILQNYFWAFLYNVVAIPLAMSGKLSPMIAAGAMTLSSISVVLNSLLLRNAIPHD